MKPPGPFPSIIYPFASVQILHNIILQAMRGNMKVPWDLVDKDEAIEVAALAFLLAGVFVGGHFV